jgi:hypothetical protein
MNFKTPILFLTYKRYKTAIRVFESIRKIKPKKLYFASNAPRDHKEIFEVEKVRGIIKKIDWQCELIKIFHTKHMEVKHSIPTSINFFFSKEKYGIILEDDCLPLKSFFLFCEKMLINYENNTSINSICGSRFVKNKGKSETYLSKYNHAWGWATWKSRWKNFDAHIKFWPKYKKTKFFLNYNPDRDEFDYWTKVFNKTYKKKINTWDYAWTACSWYHNQLSVIPPTALVQNIGFGRDATWTVAKDKLIIKSREKKLNLSIKKKNIIRNIANDRYVFQNHFKGEFLSFEKRLIHLLVLIFRDPITFFLKLKRKINV